MNLLGCKIDAVNLIQAVALCEYFIDSKRFARHLAVNASKVVAIHNDPRLQELAGACELVTADGQSVVWASRLLGQPLPERVTGIDLMHGLMERAEKKGYRVYILGAKRAVLERAVTRIRGQHPHLSIAGCRDGYFDESEDQAVVAEIRELRPDVLFVAMSSPRKEYFLVEHGRDLGVPLVMGVGGAIDVVAGVTRRAPRFMQRLGLEWLFRLLQEPRRLIRRYFVTNIRFLVLVVRAFTVRWFGRARRG
jgi:N-acetylglucosaminyldiphosphoundecaprenol N-acetyl-beta-D-mannosaminyltransferase